MHLLQVLVPYGGESDAVDHSQYQQLQQQQQHMQIQPPKSTPPQAEAIYAAPGPGMMIVQQQELQQQLQLQHQDQILIARDSRLVDTMGKIPRKSFLLFLQYYRRLHFCPLLMLQYLNLLY